jgi:hypothetical protein
MHIRTRFPVRLFFNTLTFLYRNVNNIRKYYLILLYFFKCVKQLPGSVHCGYYVCHYLSNGAGKFASAVSDDLTPPVSN